jgi:hypothetical protein
MEAVMLYRPHPGRKLIDALRLGHVDRRVLWRRAGAPTVALAEEDEPHDHGGHDTKR